VTLGLAVLEAALVVAARLTARPALGGWAALAGVLLALGLLGLGGRWFRRVVMWRLRNRLIVTYVFVAVIPVALLLAIGLITAYLFAGQFASFVVTSDIHSELRAMAAANRVRAQAAAEVYRQTHSLERAAAAVAAGQRGELRMTLWLEAKGRRQAAGESPLSLPPATVGEQERAVVGETEGLRLYAWTAVRAGEERLTLVSSVPLGRWQLEQVAADIGEVTLYAPDVSGHGEPMPEGKKDEINIDLGSPEGAANKEGKAGAGDSGGIGIRSGNRVYIRTPQSTTAVATLPAITAGTLPPGRRLDPEVVFGLPFSVVEWRTGQTATALLRVRTRPSLLYRRLFMALGEFAGLIYYVLAAVGAVFALIELGALVTGVRLTRTVTRSVADLYRATQHINRGEFDYRITVRNADQLAALETSFNAMSESLERLLVEQKAKQRMESELAIAQEVQAQLFPQRSFPLETLEIYGTCRPARTVSGDYYDFLDLGREELGIAVGDISGKGISAALMMATVHAAVRAYGWGKLAQRLPAADGWDEAERNGELAAAVTTETPAEILGLLNAHLYHSSPAEKYATLFLAAWNGPTRRLAYSNGGHVAPLVLGCDGNITRLETGGTVVGLFDRIHWEAGETKLAPGDLLIVYTDGITEPENEFGEFGEERMLEIVRENREQPLERIGQAVIAAVGDWIGAKEQPDDMTLVLARAR
jgi:sigma-B regulation protein RsbU (phosphoserine phosphatase)